MALHIGAWRFRRIIVLAIAWLLLVPVATLCYLMLRLYLDARMAGSGGIGAVSIGVSEAVVWLWFVPPPLLVGFWSVSRLRRKRRPPQ